MPKILDGIIDPPRLIIREKRWSIVAYGNRYYGVPRPLGQLDLEDKQNRKRFGIKSSENMLRLKDKMKFHTKGYRYWIVFFVSKLHALFFLINRKYISHA